jgi:Ni/Co efflux regulator RcnB
MAHLLRNGLCVAATFIWVCTAMAGEAQREQHAPVARGAREAPHGESHAGPSGYQRVTAPKGWDARPAKVDKPTYQHNFQAARSFKIGPYHRPAGWTAHRWAYGETLPRAYWAAPYLLADYWLFALEVPPAGYEWVRDGNDALLVNTDSGEILQVEYGVFA